MAGGVASHRFVGRSAELGRLEAAFAQARSGAPVTVCWRRGRGRQDPAGQRVRSTRPPERRAGAARGCIELGEGALPFGPVAEALRGLGRELGPDGLDELVGPGQPMLARLLPELGQVPAEPRSVGLTAGPWAQARLFEAVLALLERLAGRSPTVLVMEDLHWADRSTLDLLAFLVHNLQAGALLLVLTYRSDELHRRHPCSRSWPVWTEADGQNASRSTASSAPTSPTCWPASSDTARRRAASSDLRSLAGQRLLRRGAGRRRATRRRTRPAAPPGERGVDPHPGPSRRYPSGAAGRGRGVRPVEHGLLAAVAQLPEAELLAALRAAVAHQVLVPDPVSETYTFRHALTEEALYAELLPGERARLHAAFARAISEHPDLVGSNPAATPARLAYHWVKAHDPVRALPATIQAGLQAQAAYAFADAQQHFETALELWDQVPDAAEHAALSRARVLRHAAESAYTAGDPVRAIALTRRRSPRSTRATTRSRLGCCTDASAATWRPRWPGSDGRVRAGRGADPPRATVSRAGGGAGRVRRSAHDPGPLSRLARAVRGGHRDRHQVDAPVEESHARRALGVDLAFLGDLEGGIEQLRAACRIAETVAKVDDLARALTSLAGVLETFGRLEERPPRPGGRRGGRPPGTGRWHGPFLAASAAGRCSRWAAGPRRRRCCDRR